MYQDEFPQRAVSPDFRRAGVDESLPRSTRRALHRLLKASKYAEDTGRHVWEFAVTIGELRRDGVAENELRWLVCRGYIEHADEVTTKGNERAFDHQVSLRFSKRSAFVVTSAGVAFSRESLNGALRTESCTGGDESSQKGVPRLPHVGAPENGHRRSNGNICPKWDRDRRELRVGGKLIKVFKLPSPMQEAILVAFEEEHWPPRIDDPLPGHPDHLPKRRLHDTIKSLNRNQKNSLIRFMGDGTGEGIRWELIPTAEEAAHLEAVLH
jgi:hypothetical protein